jgi:hypothetical protein
MREFDEKGISLDRARGVFDLSGRGFDFKGTGLDLAVMGLHSEGMP